MKEGKFRVSRVTTRTGDKGETGLADGSRLPKHEPRIELIGTLDELNSAIGYLRTLTRSGRYEESLESIQQILFDIGSEAANPGQQHLTEAAVTGLEQHAGALGDELPPLREFVLPGGTPAAAWCHMCRTLARRAERRFTAVGTTENGDNANPVSLAYLNRLSDLFFNMSRHINLTAGGQEPQWRGPGDE